MLLLKNIENIGLKLISAQSKSTFAFFIYFLLSVFIFDVSKADSNSSTTKNNQIDIEYLESRNELEDYIIDTGDSISLKFYPADELSGIFPVNEEGELFLPKLDKTFVRGLTTSELKNLLEKRYAEFLIEPDIKVNIAVFKSIRFLVKGEIRNPGFYKFPAYESVSFGKFKIDQKSQLNNQSSENVIVKRSMDNISTISDLIRAAGGITSKTDLSRIEIIRDVPLGKGGGKKRAIIDFNSYLYESDPSSDIRIFDGDILFFPELAKGNPSQIPSSILSGLSPKFISVNLFGRVTTPGQIKVPLEASLSDAIDLTGPIKPLSGKIVLIRYEKDGTVLKKNISYSSRAKRGSKRNPYLKNNDLISVQNSFIGKSSEVIKEITTPILGIYTTKKLLED